MSQFIDAERINQASFKATSLSFSELSREDGVYRGKSRNFCLPKLRSEENLYPTIRESAIEHFSKNNIKWHQGINRKPTNHLCSSQVFCVNFLFPFANHPILLAKFFQPIFPEINYMIPVEDGYYVTFEWIGKKNYLKEKIAKNHIRTRGALFTSADSIFMFKSIENKRHIVLIEWKYTESYGNKSIKYSKYRTDRSEIYKHLFLSNDCPINKDVLPSFDSLFYDPFDQLMRQQFLANEMEKSHEMNADFVSVLHISPSQNIDIQKVTSPELMNLGDTPIEVWQKLVKNKNRFKSISTEELFTNFQRVDTPKVSLWVDYMKSRYNWITL